MEKWLWKETQGQVLPELLMSPFLSEETAITGNEGRLQLSEQGETVSVRL